MIPGILYFLIFKIAPMWGVLMSFQDYQPSLGMMRSNWVGMKHFDRLFQSPDFWRLFRALRHGRMGKDDAVTIVNLLLNTFYREMMELPEEHLELWRTETMPVMNDAFAVFESLDKVKMAFYEALVSFEQTIRELRESKQYAPMVEQIRDYIDRHYANPDISLAHLGEVFDTNPKYISFMFKEQLGIKFVDYLADVRIEQAKRLLLSTDLLIPDIAARVGYIHVVSFNRVFKKTVGLTPGSFRNRKQQES